MTVTFSGQLTEPMLHRALVRHLRGFRLFGVSMFLLGLLASAVGWALAPPNEGFRLAFPFFVLLACGAAFWFTPWWAARKQFRSGSLLRAPIQGSATEAGVHFAAEYGSSEIPWHVFHQARVSPDTVLLYPTNAIFHLVPREFFADQAAWESFVGLVRGRVARVKS